MEAPVAECAAVEAERFPDESCTTRLRRDPLFLVAAPLAKEIGTSAATTSATAA
jgi:hypothetical protein